MELDVSKKVRTAIKAKLLELGVHVDEELPDYIMILIANRRTKSQMEEDLGLFLGDNTMKFSNWLHQVLKKLQEVTTTAPKSVGRQSSAEDLAKENKVEEPKRRTSSSSTDKKHEVARTESKEEVTGKRRHSDENSDAVSSSSGTVAKKLKTDSDNTNTKHSSVPLNKKEEEVLDSKRLRKPEVTKEDKKESDSSQGEREEPLKSRNVAVRAPSPVRVRPVRSTIVRGGGKESPMKDRSPPIPRKRSYQDTRLDNGTTTSSRRPAREKSRSRSTSPTSKARKSLRSLVAVVKRHNELNAARDEKESSYKKKETVASVIKAPERPKREIRGSEKGSNKLLFRALADAQRSIVSHAVTSSAKVTTASDKDDIPEKSDTKNEIEAKRKEPVRSRLGISSRLGKRAENVTNYQKSVKDRLGYRMRDSRGSDEDYGNAEYDPSRSEFRSEEEYVPSSSDDLKTIVVNVPFTKTAKSRMVTLEDKSANDSQGYQPAQQLEDEKVDRISIQVKNDSDTSDDEDDEIDSRAHADLKRQDAECGSETKKLDRGEKTKSEDGDNDSSDSGSQDEEVEIEEYEEVDEDEDDGEYEVVLQEKNETLPDPDDDISTAAPERPAKIIPKSKADQENKTKAAISSYKPRVDEARETVSSAPARTVITKPEPKFVVTMESMEGIDESTHANSAVRDLRQRITRSVVNDKLPTVPSFAPLAQTSFGFNYNRLTAPVPTPSTTTCKYWPECQFKDKCIYPHPKCKFGASCTKPDCPYKHDAFVVKPSKLETMDNGKVQCKFFPKCHSMSCQFYHPSPCRYGVGCTDIKCTNYHPGQTLAQQRLQTKQGMSRSSFRPPPPAAHLLRWKAPVGNSSTQDSTNTSATVSQA